MRKLARRDTIDGVYVDREGRYMDARDAGGTGQTVGGHPRADRPNIGPSGRISPQLLINKQLTDTYTPINAGRRVPFRPTGSTATVGIVYDIMHRLTGLGGTGACWCGFNWSAGTDVPVG